MCNANKIQGFLRAMALRWLAIGMVAVMGLAPVGAVANPAINNEWNAVYSGASISCAACHSGTPNGTTGLSPLALDVRARLNATPAQSISAAIAGVRSYLGQPSLTTVEALNQSGTAIASSAPSGAIAVPLATASLRLTFTPGVVSGLHSAPVLSLTSTGFSSGSFGVSSSGSGNTYAVSIPSTLEARRSYGFSVAPTNSAGISGAATAVGVTSPNTPPVAVADAFSPLLSQVQNASGMSIPFAMSVLTTGTRDSDPDDADANLTVSPPAPALSPAYGSVAVNASGTGYVYTAPATLAATARSVTFQYSAVDEESGQSAPVSVTINVPAAAVVVPAKQFVANDDLFLVSQGGTLTGADVKLNNGNGADDLDGALLSALTFSSDDVSSGTLTFRANGTFDYTPLPSFSGDATFSYQFNDGTSTAGADVTIRVAAGNTAPAVSPIQLVSVNEARAAFVEDLLNPANVTDADGDTLSVQNVAVAITQRPLGAISAVDPAAAVSVNGAAVTITPSVFEELDANEFADIVISYDVSDGTETVANTMRLTVNGLATNLARVAGAYADTLSSRYVSNAFGPHFEGQSGGLGSCLACHATLDTINVSVATVDQCEETPGVFTAYGLDLCLNRDANTPPLTDLLRRMAEAEAKYAPVLAATDTLQVLQSSPAGTAIGAPLTASSTGLDVFGATARIHSYLINTDAGTPATTDPTGQFQISDNGQISVASSSLTAGTYTLIVLPVNDAGQRDSSARRVAKPGFYRQVASAANAVTIEVVGDVPTPVDDILNAVSNTASTVVVLANDGGTAESVSIVTAPQNGSAVVNSDLSITYTPNTDFTGTDSFSYNSRSSAGVSARVATVAITVVSPDAVRAVNDNVTAVAGEITVIDVLANDENIRRSGSDATIVTITGQPDPDTEGSVAVEGQNISFTPKAGFTGSTSITYLAANPTASGALGSTATVSLQVVAVGDEVISAQMTDPELLKVAQVFEQSCSIVRSNPSPDAEAQQFLDICTSLTIAASNDEDLAQAMRALRNEEHFAVVDATATVARGLGRVVSRRLSQIRDGDARGFNTDGVSLTIDGQSLPSDLVTKALRGMLGFGDDPVGTQKWGLFVAGDIAWAERDASTNSGGYDLEATNLMIGYDRILSDRQSLGVALGYAETTTDFGGGGSLSSEGYQATVYGVHKDFIRRDLTLEGYLSVGQMSFNSDRRINFANGGANVDAIANAEFDGTYINIVPTLSYGRVLGDYNDPIRALRTATRVTWSASLDYLWMNIDDYTETGGAGLALDVGSESYQSMILAFGVDASRPIYIGADSRAEIYGGIEIRGELLDKDRTVSSAFVAAGPDAPRFLVNESGTYGLGAGIEIGTVISLGPKGQIDLNYGYDFTGGGLSTQHLSLGYRQNVSRNGSMAINLSRSFRDTGSDGATAELSYKSRF